MIVIHVCDEGRRLTHDFRCPKHVLLSEMAYFRSYLDGTESADDIDISVHCDMQVRRIEDWCQKKGLWLGA